MSDLTVWDSFMLVLIAAVTLFGLWLTARIARKAGYSGWWSLLMLVPVLNLILIYVFAFAKWPIMAKSRDVP